MRRRIANLAMARSLAVGQQWFCVPISVSLLSLCLRLSNKAHRDVTWKSCFLKNIQHLLSWNC